mmetsp:Transcript_5271/g.14791  ORF Transcript_5271/g.14791 Transcript_5271/m.14791 type:complete len:448 (-) Transcript_5271:1508-2851(-)|eukprot:CAMPEP_0168746186 /NCGR_PEP_ID=MMETSP0724-20121128/15014_1 /TAXON_ID=265536 /ORGANISM="Amphiprora sp., Strain CCMP467" /LENGTH=447 /DNA_ID=CAMNT_0008793943 /DNA_START=129 /DNA_END=1472 /DNA_ORIENTATION=+
MSDDSSDESSIDSEAELGRKLDNIHKRPPETRRDCPPLRMDGSCDEDNSDNELEDSFDESPRPRKAAKKPTEIFTLSSDEEEDDDDENDENNNAVMPKTSALRLTTQRQPLQSSMIALDDSSDDDDEEDKGVNRKEVDPAIAASLQKARATIRMVSEDTQKQELFPSGRPRRGRGVRTRGRRQAAAPNIPNLAAFYQIGAAQQQLLMQQLSPEQRKLYQSHLNEATTQQQQDDDCDDDEIVVLGVDNAGDYYDDDIEVTAASNVTLTVQAEIQYLGTDTIIHKTLPITMKNTDEFRTLKPRLEEALELKKNNSGSNFFAFRYKNAQVFDFNSPDSHSMEAEGETLCVTVKTKRGSSSSKTKASKPTPQKPNWGKLLEFSIRTQKQDKYECKLGERQPFEQLVQDLRSKIPASPAQLKLVFDGEALNLKQTPQDLDMEDGDMIELVGL